MLLAAVLVLLQSATTANPPASPRTVAVTFDDLPVVSVVPLTEAGRDTTTTRLLAALARHQIPATGFVNENKLYDSTGTLVPGRVDLLRRWLAAGHQLGNHTWSHPDLHRTPLDSFEAEILKGEQVTRTLLRERGLAPRYFRHPFLHTGRSVAIRDSLTDFLSAHGYRVAPVTIDNAEYIYAAAYDRAREAGDEATTRRIRADYLAYMDTVVGFYQRQARLIVGREPPQVLLLHANRLNADTFDRLAAIFTRRRYRFVSLDRALEDPAYRLPDHYEGPAGITWLHRWAITAGLPGSTFRGEPEAPAWVEDLSRAR